MTRESTRHTFLVSLVLCLVCSLLVSGAAVSLRDLQEENKTESQRRNILMAAFPRELPDEDSFAEFYSRRNVAGITEYFPAHVESFRVDLQDGEKVETSDADRDYDQVKAARDPGLKPKLKNISDSPRLARGILMTPVGKTSWGYQGMGMTGQEADKLIAIARIIMSGGGLAKK